MRKQLLTQVRVCNRLLLTSLLLLAISFSVTAQSPGGVSSDLEAWFKPESGVTISASATADEVETWVDQSPNGRDATQTTLANMPLYLDVGLNMNPTLDFTTALRYFESDFISPLVNTEYTIISVGERVNINESYFIGQAGTATRNDNLVLGFRNTSRYTHAQWSNDIEVDLPAISGTSNTAFMSNGSVGVSGGRLSKMFLNNELSSPFETITANNEALENSTIGYIGRGSPYANHHHKSRLSEVLVYSRRLSSSERERVESYLAVKYGFALPATQSFLNSSNVPVWNPANNTGYTFDVFGIARDDASTLNQKISRSLNDTNGILTVALENNFTDANFDAARTVTHANDGQYMLFGSNGLTTTAQTTEVDNATLGALAQGIEREWVVRTTANFTQTVSLQFDGLDDTYTLITNTTGDFSSGVTVVGVLDASGVISGVTLTDGQYFTVVSGEVIPEITLIGQANVSVETGTSYTEQGATAFDNVDGDISASIVVGGDTVDASTAGTYTVTYNVSDAAGNAANEVTRIVVVSSDTTAPVVTLIGNASISQPQGDAYVEQGALAQDETDGDLTASITISGTVDTNTPGVYTITYSVLDAANNLGQATRTITITDAIAPVITLNDSSLILHPVGDTYTDAGATALDNVDGNLTASIVVGGDTVDVNTEADYVITFNVSDAAGNAATEVTRTVRVTSNPGTPVISLLGNATVNHPQGAVYSDAGATATDDSGDLTPSIVVGGDTVDNTTVVGTYTITYNVSDADGNAATEVTRTVNVIADTTAPVITLIGGDFSQDVNGPAYNDAGATATDDSDGDITANIVVGGDTVDITTAGTYTITYNVSDAAGNAATEVTRTVTINADSTPPTITLNGGNVTQNINDGTAYTDAGATATDAIDGVLTGSIVVGGDTVDVNTVGVYTITYNVSDAAGNAATEVTRTVTIEDTTAPVITLTGSATVTHEAATAYADAGSSVSDNYDTGLTATVGGDTVDVNTLGTYTITYNVSDAAGNAATEVTRVVTVVDTTAPVITLTGDAAVSVEQATGTYTEQGATATDAVSTGLTVTVGGDTVDVNTAGTYTITYNVSDGAGNAATEVTRVVTVADTTAPVITLTGDAAVSVEQATGTYTEQGATATDAVSTGLTVTVGGDTVDVNTAGTYTVTYNVSDAAGNAATEVTRVVTVADTTAPVITLTGDAAVSVEQGGTYTEQGATATDAVSTGLTVTVGGDTVDVNTAGTYTVTYNVSDAAGNAATEVTRVVTVADTTAPVITLTGDAAVSVEQGGTYTEQGATATDNVDTGLTVTVGGDTVDANTAGTYTVTYNVSDAAGNAATEVTRVVTVADTTAPVITLTGDAAVSVEQGGTYTEQGATATDAVSTGLTVTVGGDTVDANTEATYTITYNVSDAAGNAATEVTRVVTVADTTAPTFDVDGNTANFATNLAEGATYTVGTIDNIVDVNLTTIAIGGDTVDTNTPATYTVTYTVTDGSAAANAATITETVTVGPDSAAPTFDVDGNTADYATSVELGATYTVGTIGNIVDASPTTSAIGGDTVDANTEGTYTVTYTVTDTSAGTNSTTITETVTVADTTAPTFDVDGNTADYTTNLAEGATYTAGTIGNIVDVSSTTTAIGGDTVDTNTPATYTVTYTVTDGSNATNASTITETVVVTATAPITGDDTVTSDVNGDVDIAGSGSLTVNNDANINGDVVIADGAELTLNGTGTITGDVTITDGGSLIATDGAVTGTITHVRNVPTTNWYLISSPVTGQDKDTFVGASNLATGSGNNVGFSDYDNASGAWSYYQTGASGTGNFVLGEGHAVKLNATGSVSFSGSFNNADASVAVSSGAANNFNLIGNPYLAYVSVSEMVTANNALLAEQTVWLWDQAADAYVQKNLTADLEVAPGQGFFVLTNAAGNFSITEAMQSHNATNTFQRVTRPEIALTLSNGNISRTAEIFYINGTTKGFDNGYDSSIFEGFANEFAVYTRAVANGNGRNLGIQSLPQGGYESMIVPVGVNAVAGSSLEFSARSANLPAGTYVYLEDKNTNTFTRIDNATYRVTTSKDLNGVGQFYIHTTSSVLAAPTNTLDNVSVYASNNETLKVEGITEGQAQVRMYSILGKQVINTTITGNGNNRVALPKLQTGVYLVEVQSALGTLNKKLIIE